MIYYIEIMCIFDSSGVIWESKKPNKRNFEPMNIRDNALLEDAFKKGQAGTTLSDGGEADLELKQIKKPSIRDIRRTYHPGLWFMMKASKHQRLFHAKLHTLQVDCQMADCVFPTILAPVPPPKSVAADKGKLPISICSIG
jgi:vacuolar protein sorting-associated protein 13A/C